MSELISGVVSQVFQKTLNDQALKQQQQPTTGGNQRSFESYLQNSQDTSGATNGKISTEGTQTDKSMSPVEMENKLKELQKDLTEKTRQNDINRSQMDSMMSKMLEENDTRLGFIREANANLANNSNFGSNFTGQLSQVESEFKEVEAIMRSNKNLSPGELLALQARLYQVSQHIEVMSKVVDQMAGGIKTVLNTNI